MSVFNAVVNGVKFEFLCEFRRTRNGFCHNVRTWKNDNYLGLSRVSYLNRTWESFEFQSALNHACAKYKINHHF